MLQGIKTHRQIIFITFILTCAITCISLGITALIHHLTDTQMGILGISSAIVAPLLISPLIIYKFLDIIRQLHLAHELLENISREDYLTGVFNRRHLEQTAAQEFSLAKRHKFAVSVMMLDIDHFKQINDQHGHQVGDQVPLNSHRLSMKLFDKPTSLVDMAEKNLCCLCPTQLWTMP